MIGQLLKEVARSIGRYVGSCAGRASRHPDRTAIGASPLLEKSDNALPSLYEPRCRFDWQLLTTPDRPIYAGGPVPGALDLFIHEPRFVLDVGCSNGDISANVKLRYPRSQIWGIEPNERAAEMAATRIDRVLIHTFEEIDWHREGVRRGDIDTVLLFDVLEHIYNPWKTLLTLRNLVSASAQLLVSIPNVRNALLLQDLISGYWRYRPAGLLDITHIRFFTRNDMYRIFYQTGFRVVSTASTQCHKSGELFQRYHNGPFPLTVELGSASIKVESMDDLMSLCAVQHMFALQPADYEQLSPDERHWIDDPHPPTLAFASG